MSGKNKTHKPRYKRMSILEAYHNGEEAFIKTVDEALRDNRLDHKSLKPIIRADPEIAAACLWNLYAMAGTQNFDFSEFSGDDLKVDVNIFALTVNGRAQDILNAAKTKDKSLSQMCAETDIFGKGSISTVFPFPFALEDLEIFSPNDVSDLGWNVFSGFMEKSESIDIQVPKKEEEVIGDISRVFVGVTFRKREIGDSEKSFGEDSEVRAYLEEAQKVFGDRCNVSLPLPFADIFQEAARSTLDVLAAKSEPGAFADFPKKTVSRDKVVWAFTSSDGGRVCMEVPLMTGVLVEAAVDAWVMARPEFCPKPRAGRNSIWVADVEGDAAFYP